MPAAVAAKPRCLPCPVCDETPRVLVAIRHPGMRLFTQELLRREHHCWVAAELTGGERLAEALRQVDPDLLVIDGGEFPACCRVSLHEYPPDRVIVVGVEPDPGYQGAALRHGAGAWIPRDRVGEELGPAMRRVLNCRHDPCAAVTVAPSGNLRSGTVIVEA